MTRVGLQLFRGRAWIVLAVGAGIVAACGSAIPTASPPASVSAPTGALPTPVASAAATQTADSGTPSPAPGSSASPPPPAGENPTSAALIEAAVARSELDETTALTYRVMAAFGDERVPDQYRGVVEEDLPALELAQERLDELPPVTQDTLRPFLVRPTDPLSIWSAGPSASLVRLASLRKGAVPDRWSSAAPPCVNGWTHEQVTPFIPAVVWGECNLSGSVGTAYDQVKAAIADLWNPMTAYMGDPLGDAAPFGFNGPPEEGDGLIDFYVVQQSQLLGTRWIDPSVTAIAFARAIPQYQGSAGSQRSSGYMVINPFKTSSASGLKSTVAHEFFHILQNAHNAFGYRIPDGTFHWFVEASAKWSEHYFVSAGRPDEVYPWFTKYFQATWTGLSWPRDDNPYASFTWPLFMQQDAGGGARGQ